MKGLVCPIANGGCGGWQWYVAVDRFAKRIVADCIVCDYRISLPLDLDALTEFRTGPLDESGPEIRS